jgi:hypothetical protein
MEERSFGGGVSVGGSWFKGYGRPSRTFASGRVCSEPGCETKLSIYNDGDFCYLHEREAHMKLRGKKIA